MSQVCCDKLEKAVEKGHLNCVKALFTVKGDYYSSVYSKMKTPEHLECLRYLIDQVNNPDLFYPDLATSAVNYDLPEWLDYILQKHCFVDKNFCDRIIHRNRIDCLKIAHKHNLPWDEGTCANAAYVGNLECLQYLHENRCPWDDATPALAARNNHFDCYKYAVDQGCPVNVLTDSIARENGFDYQKTNTKSPVFTEQQLEMYRRPRKQSPKVQKKSFSKENQRLDALAKQVEALTQRIMVLETNQNL